MVLTVDVEPDAREHGWAAGAGDWASLDVAVEALEVLRQRLRECLGAAPAFAWFVRADPQIERAHGDAAWGLRRHGGVLRRLAASGDSVGLHVHGFRWSEEREGWITDHADAGWVGRCIATGWSAFTDSWGAPPRSFRFGDRFLCNSAVRQLERLGCRVDLTVEAGMHPVPRLVAAESATGELPDYRRVPRRPYRPSRLDFRRTGWPARRLWHLPVSTGCINAKPVIPPRVESGHAMVHLNLALDPGWIRGILDACLAEDAVVVSVLRTGDLAVPAARDRLGANLEHLATHPAMGERPIVVPEQAVRLHAAVKTAAGA